MNSFGYYSNPELELGSCKIVNFFIDFSRELFHFSFFIFLSSLLPKLN
jgi:hypothetical protein